MTTGYRGQLAARAFIARATGPRHMLRRQRLRKAYRRSDDSRMDAAVERMWTEAAAEAGAEMRRLGANIFEFRRGGSVARVSEQTTPLTDKVTSEILRDKPVATALLREAGLPLPEAVVVEATDHAAALAFLTRVSPPLVVKPADGSGGAGVMGCVCSERQLEQALQNAARYHALAILERQVVGDCYRITLLDGEVLDVLRRDPPRLRGDGVSNIGTLMLREFERRVASGGDAAGFKSFEVDHDTIFTLEHQGLTLDSVIPAGQSVVVKTATNFGGPEQTRTATLGEGVIDPARRAAAILGVRLAGVDVLAPDPQAALVDSGGVILEVNVPALLHHYNVAEPERATRVAVPVLEALLAAGGPRDEAAP